MPERLCGPDCLVPNEPHIDPEPDWIGNYPVMHGESERPVPGSGGWNGVYNELPDMYCLCGHPNYMICPEQYTRGIGALPIVAAESEPFNEETPW